MRSLAWLALLSASPSVFAGVFVVGPPPHYATIGAAIAASQDGDTILVRPGTYPGFSLSGEARQVLADPPGAATCAFVSVYHHPAGATSIVSGLLLDPAASFSSAIRVSLSQGHVRLERLVQVSAPNPLEFATDGAQVDDSSDVVLVGCSLRGSEGSDVVAYSGGGGGHALRVEGAQVALYDCDLRGGPGRDAFVSGGNTYFAGYGGTAAYALEGATLFASGTSFTGGEGGYASGQSSWGSGGPCVATESGAAAWLLAPELTPGQNGWPNLQPGFETWGAVVELPGAARRLFGETREREGATLDLQVLGEPGDVAWLQLAPEAGWTLDLARSGVVTWAGARRFPLGTIPASGTISASLPVAELGPGVDTKTWFLQLVCREPSGAVVLGSPASAVLLDAAH